MEALNRAVFLLINAPENPNEFALWIAKILANDVVFLIPIGLVIGWLSGVKSNRMAVLQASIAGITGLLVNQLICLIWTHPRPFMIHLGHTSTPHIADSSFPSDHLTLLWAVGASFCGYPPFCKFGVALCLLGLPVAWSRIYLGVHFPLDMLGSAIVACLCAWAIYKDDGLLLAPGYQMSVRLYGYFFAPLIQRGWLKK